MREAFTITLVLQRQGHSERPHCLSEQQTTPSRTCVQIPVPDPSGHKTHTMDLAGNKSRGSPCCLASFHAAEHLRHRHAYTPLPPEHDNMHVSRRLEQNWARQDPNGRNNYVGARPPTDPANVPPLDRYSTPGRSVESSSRLLSTLVFLRFPATWGLQVAASGIRGSGLRAE